MSLTRQIIISYEALLRFVSEQNEDPSKNKIKIINKITQYAYRKSH